MALTRRTAPLELAARILPEDVIREIFHRPEYTVAGFEILDRWALNQPKELLNLYHKSYASMKIVLLMQQRKEFEALCSESAHQMEMSGMSNWEILERLGIETSLVD